QNGKFVPLRPKARHDPQLTAMAPSRNGPAVFATLDGLLAWEAGKFQPMIATGVLPRSPVTSVAQTPSRDVWLGTGDAGAWVVHNGNVAPLRHGLPSLHITCLLADSDEQVYVGTDRGLVRWNGSGFTTEGIAEALRNLPIRAILSDRDGNIWI